jgi:predicted AAA+ superfamily ATPase
MTDYLPRHAEKTIKELARMYGAVLVTGMRQVGKTTLLSHTTAPMKELTFDNAATFEAAARAPELFFDYNPPPIFLDEIQKAPDLFSQMKQIIDSNKKKGLFFLSGSQQFHMMKYASDSLAGRIGIVNLAGLSLRELNKSSIDLPFAPTSDYFKEVTVKQPPLIAALDVWKIIHRGSMPSLALNPDYSWDQYYGAYLRTYIQRDVRELTQIDDQYAFQTFMNVLAARTGQMLNMDEVARTVGISSPTAKRWLSILIASNIVFLLQPYYSNLTKRAIKTPKLYFTDTGLAAYLARWNTPDALRLGAMAGAFFETFVVMEIVKSYYNAGILQPPLYYFRDRDKNEIDLIIETDGHLHPIEIKTTGLPNLDDIKAFSKLDNLSVPRGSGGVVCLADTMQAMSKSDRVIPLSLL